MGCFVLPQEVYAQPDLRATFTGIAAAAGKLGAVIGIWLFEALTPEIGLGAVLGVVAAFALLAARLSHTCISDELWERQRQQMAAADEKRAAAAARKAAERKVQRLEKRLEEAEESSGGEADAADDVDDAGCALANLPPRLDRLHCRHRRAALQGRAPDRAAGVAPRP